MLEVSAMTTILSTVAGSHLYGLNHASSDYDTYEVVLAGCTRQRVVGRFDLTTVTLRDYLKQVEKGVPQALEVLFSPVKVVEPEWAAYFAALRPDYYSTLAIYQRTIRNFLESGTAKKWKHAVRLSFNLRDFRAEGLFDPRLDVGRRAVVQGVERQRVAENLVKLNYPRISL